MNSSPVPEPSSAAEREIELSQPPLRRMLLSPGLFAQRLSVVDHTDDFGHRHLFSNPGLVALSPGVIGITETDVVRGQLPSSGPATQNPATVGITDDAAG